MLPFTTILPVAQIVLFTEPVKIGSTTKKLFVVNKTELFAGAAPGLVISK